MDIASLVELKKNPKIPDIVPGDTVKVSARIVEGGKERIQVFQGVIIGLRRGGAGANFTVRHVASGIGVERTFPFYSPLVEKVEVVRHGKVRRAKLYYLRGLSGKAARRKIKRVDRKVEKIGEEELVPQEVVEPVLEVAEEAVPEPEAEMAQEEQPEAAVEEPASEEAPEPEAVLEAEPSQEEVKEPALEKEPEEAPVMEKEEEPEAVVEPAEDQEQEPEKS